MVVSGIRFISESLILAHILAVCAVALALVKFSWTGSPLINVSEEVPAGSGFFISFGCAIAATFALVYFLRKKTRVRPWMLKVGICGVFYLVLLDFEGVLTPQMDAFSAFVLPALFATSFYLLSESKKWRDIAVPLYTFFIATAVGFSFTMIFPLTLVLVFVAVVAAYDIYAVFKGPLGNMFKLLEKKGLLDLIRYSGLVTPIKGRMLGLGDSVFYSVLFCSVSINLGLLAGFFSLAGIVTGFLVTIHFAKTKPMPALPLSISLGIGLMLLTRI